MFHECLVCKSLKLAIVRADRENNAVESKRLRGEYVDHLMKMHPFKTERVGVLNGREWVVREAR